MSHIEKRRNLWYATLKVPPKLQPVVGKAKFLQSLGTPDRRRAETLAMPVVALWKAQLRKAGGETDAVLVEAMRWREAIKQVQEVGDEDSEQELRGQVVEAAYALEDLRGETVARRWASVAQGEKTPSSLHLEEWKASIAGLKQKTQDQMVKDVQRLVDNFPMLEDITPRAASRWVAQLQKEGASVSSLERMMSAWRSYWKFLMRPAIGAAPPKSDPFDKDYVLRTRADKKEPWLPFPAEDVPKLWAAAEAKKDQQLADLIRLGAYTGARIDELCKLKLSQVKEDRFCIGEAKTAAGVREFPIHTAIRPLIQRLRAESEKAGDEYLLAGLQVNKYGIRADAIGKRFGRLKTKLGYGKLHVFHSLRKTLVTLLENAGVPEGLAADIVGHEKQTMTYGLYSGGSYLETMAPALELVRYPQVAHE